MIVLKTQTAFVVILGAQIQILSPPVRSYLLYLLLPASPPIPLIFSINQLTVNLREGHHGDALEDNVLNCSYSSSTTKLLISVAGAEGK